MCGLNENNGVRCKLVDWRDKLFSYQSINVILLVWNRGIRCSLKDVDILQNLLTDRARCSVNFPHLGPYAGDNS